MVDVTVTILGSSLSVNKSNLRYKVKTKWCQVEIKSGIGNSVQLPRLPLINHYFLSEGSINTFFVELWYKDVDSGVHIENEEIFDREFNFFGLSKCSIESQLQNPNLNPKVEWSDVYDPILNANRGKLLLQIEAKFSLEVNRNVSVDIDIPRKIHSEENKISKSSPGSVSSYFTTTANYLPHREDSACQEVQTDISLVSIPNKLHNYAFFENNTIQSTNSYFVSDCDSVSRIQIPSLTDGTAVKGSESGPLYTRKRMAHGQKLHTESHHYDNINKLEQTHGRSVYNGENSPLSMTCLTERSNSVENIISLLKDLDSQSLYKNGKPINEKKAAPGPGTSTAAQTFHASRKTSYKSSKIIMEEGRLAPEGRNESDNIRTQSMDAFLKTSKNGLSNLTHRNIDNDDTKRHTANTDKNSVLLGKFHNPISRPRRMAANLYNN